VERETLKRQLDADNPRGRRYLQFISRLRRVIKLMLVLLFRGLHNRLRQSSEGRRA
jgi:hypothetical protein